MGLSGQALRSLADNIRDGLIVVDEGRVCWANAPFGAMAGRIGACLNELPVDEVLRGLPAPSKARGPEVVEAEVLHTDGRPRAVRCVRAWYSPGLDACAWLIEDLDVKCRDRFEQIFSDIRENFAGNSGMFRQMFQGGSADITMQAAGRGHSARGRCRRGRGGVGPSVQASSTISRRP